MATTQLIKFKRGLKAALPANANLGEPLFASNTAELYIGTGPSTAPVLISGEDRYVMVGSAGTPDYLNASYFARTVGDHITINTAAVLTGVDVDMVDGKNVNDSSVSTDDLWTAFKAKQYIDSLITNLDWQNSVLATLDTPAVSPPTGGRYLVGTTPAGVFVGHANQIAVWGGSSYTYITPNPGFAVWDETDDVEKLYDGAAWTSMASTTNHNATSGLDGGQSGQYYHLTSAQESGLTGGLATTLHTHNTDSLTEGVTNLFFTTDRVVGAVAAVIDDTNSVNFTDSVGVLTLDLKSQTTDSITLAVDASGLKADLKTQNTNGITLSVDASGLKATLNNQDTDSMTLSIPDALGLKMDVNIDIASLVIDEITGVAVLAVDGGAF